MIVNVVSAKRVPQAQPNDFASGDKNPKIAVKVTVLSPYKEVGTAMAKINNSAPPKRLIPVLLRLTDHRVLALLQILALIILPFARVQNSLHADIVITHRVVFAFL